MKKNVLIIGGSGFLGSHIADTLSDQGHMVRIFDRVDSPWRREDQELVIGDVLDTDSLDQACKGMDAVFHLAGIAEIAESGKDPKKTMQINVMGSMNAIEAAMKANVRRFLFASTVYVFSSEGSFYRVSKNTVEMLLRNYSKEQGLEYTILRYGSLYGPRAQGWNGLYKLVKRALVDKRIEYAGTGDERREFIHINDAAELSVKALGEEFANKCLTITGGQSVSLKEFLHMLREIMNGNLDLSFVPEKRDSLHYSLTPYRFTPHPGVKMVPSVYRDLGQGIYELVEDVYRQELDETEREGK